MKTSPCSSPSRCKARASSCPTPTTCPALSGSAAATAPSSASTRCRPASDAPVACSPGTLGPASPIWSRWPSRSPAATCRSARAAARLGTRSGLRLSGTRDLARVDLRAQRHGHGRRSGDTCRAAGSATSRRAPPRLGEYLLAMHPAARGALRRRQGGARARPHLGHRPSASPPPARGLWRFLDARQPGLFSQFVYRAALPRSSHPEPGGGSLDQRAQRPAPARRRRVGHRLVF